jgi:hypothetical protein
MKIPPEPPSSKPEDESGNAPSEGTTPENDAASGKNENADGPRPEKRKG